MKHFIETLVIFGVMALTAITYFCLNFILVLFNTPHDAKLIAEILSGIFCMNLLSNFHIIEEEVEAE